MSCVSHRSRAQFGSRPLAHRLSGGMCRESSRSSEAASPFRTPTSNSTELSGSNFTLIPVLTTAENKPYRGVGQAHPFRRSGLPATSPAFNPPFETPTSCGAPASRRSMDEPGFWTRFVIAALGAWRITHLVAAEDGPADVIVRARARLGDGSIGRLLDCFYCLSVWVAAPMAFIVVRDPLERLATWIALSGAACLFERFTADIGTRKAEAYELLRSEARGAA